MVAPASKGVYRAKGTEVMNAMVCTFATAYTGMKLYNIDVYPEAIGLRVGMLANLWEKYIVNSLDIRVVLVGPSTDDLALILAYDLDCMDSDPPMNADGLRQLSSFQHNMTFCHSAGSPRVLHIVPRAPPSGGYFTNEAQGVDPRFVYAGQLYLYVVAPPSASVYTIQTYCDYDITLFEPQVQALPMIGAPGNYNLDPSTQPPTTANEGFYPVYDAVLEAATAAGLTVRETAPHQYAIELLRGRSYFISLQYRPAAGLTTSCGYDYTTLVGSATKTDTYKSLTQYNGYWSVLNEVIHVTGTTLLYANFLATAYAESSTAAFAIIIGRAA